VYKLVDIFSKNEKAKTEKAKTEKDRSHPSGILWTNASNNETSDNVVNLETYKRYRRRAR